MKTIHPQRIRPLNSVPVQSGAVIYWMSRDQRLEDNWALLYAQQQAIETQQPLHIVFILSATFGWATQTHYNWMVQGLRQLSETAQTIGLSFQILVGEPKMVFQQMMQEKTLGLLVTDYSPLRYSKKTKDLVATLPIALHEVDAHNCIPPWVITQKTEYSAATIRPKIHRLLDEWLVEFPKLATHQLLNHGNLEQSNWELVSRVVRKLAHPRQTINFQSGKLAAHKQLQSFISHRLSSYDSLRNKPESLGQSDLSPYLHFGQISPQRVALSVLQSRQAQSHSAEVFLEELLVRRELAENFCEYQAEYDSAEVFPSWARATLHDHEQDIREHLYSYEQLESGETHDELWNAAQQQMVQTGKMHGYMRMYWAKQLLRWTKSVREAHAIALQLNDTYELDGRDPNGYAGIAWALGGVHDRPWPAQPIFGTLRSMSFQSTSKKFDWQTYRKNFGTKHTLVE